MAALIYQLEVRAIGEFVRDYLQENKLILFAEPAPADIAFYCALHRPGELNELIQPGQKMRINQRVYAITAVGEAANKNLAQLGHITLSFDGAQQAELPGAVHVSGAPPPLISVGDRIVFSYG
ncbi:PTS system glucitol/sorbitol-specific EIIA component [Mixta theicola]|nr:PTS glucitol/sorbitol transporter subunit IIA [Mixta theicola]QHM75871.1 PTS system glucitol/sorbitol-specific EIIA component [Mixta theicola]